MVHDILIIFAIAFGVSILTMLGFAIYLVFQHRKMIKELREEGFYD
jgi:heme exporter protein D